MTPFFQNSTELHSIWVHCLVKLMGSPSHSLTMGWEMLHTLRVVEPTQVNSPDDDDDAEGEVRLYRGWNPLSHDSPCRKGFTNSRGINQLFIDNWLSLFEMTSIVRENPSTDEGIRGTPAVHQWKARKSNPHLIEGADVHADRKLPRTIDNIRTPTLLVEQAEATIAPWRRSESMQMPPARVPVYKIQLVS